MQEVLVANEKSGQHTVGPITASSNGGSCSISVSSRAGQGLPVLQVVMPSMTLALGQVHAQVLQQDPQV